MNLLKALFIVALLMFLEAILVFWLYRYVLEYLPMEQWVYYMRIINLSTQLVSYLIVFMVFKINISWRETQNELKNLDWKLIKYLLILTVGFEFLDRPFFDFSRIVDFIKTSTVEPYILPEKSTFSIFYRGFLTLLIAPIFEELLFRKYMFTELLKKYSLTVSIISSSALFSLIHLPVYRNLIPTFVFGVVCCLVYIKTKNIVYTIVLHFFTNLSLLLLTIYGESYYKWMFGLEFNFFYWLLFGVGGVLLWFGIKKIMTVN